MICRTVAFVALLWGLACVSTEATAIGRLRQTFGIWTADAPRGVRFPDSFEVAYTYSLPYVETYQSGGLRYPVRVWVDAAHGGKQRMDTWNGTNILITEPGMEVEVSPHVDHLKCLLFEPDDEEPQQPATATVHRAAMLHGVLPNVGKWEYMGPALVQGETVSLWQLKEQHEAKVVLYKFYIRQLKHAEWDEPLLLTLHGNALDGSHFDEWRYDFHEWIPGRPKASVFERPPLCDTVEPTRRTGLTSHALQMAALLPPPILASGRDPHYDLFSALHGRQHADAADYQRRLATYRSNALHIVGHNADSAKPYRMAINRFADWSEEEFRSIMLPARGLRAKLPPPHADLLHKRRVAKELVPSTVDWSHTVVDSVVKDQSACGSCWAFGASSAMEAAWAMATGERLLFSEQACCLPMLAAAEIMDCAWGYTENKACDGGLAEGAFDYIKDAGGIRLESDIPYRGQDNFCADKNKPSENVQRYRFKGYKAIPEGDIDALKEAVYTHGPHAVSIDAAKPGFRFYSEGVYVEPKCGWKHDDLDHSVTLVGYGRSDHGTDYWHIRNSWSTWWGDEGYIKISREGHACGVATNALYGVPDVSSRMAA